MASNQILVEFSVINATDYGQATLDRNIAPRTVALINYQLRKAIQTRIVVREGEVSFPFKIGRASPENVKKSMQRGDIAYWTQSNILIIFLKKKDLAYPVNLVGHVNSKDINFFDKLKIGRSIKIEKIKSAIDEADYL